MAAVAELKKITEKNGKQSREFQTAILEDLRALRQDMGTAAEQAKEFHRRSGEHLGKLYDQNNSLADRLIAILTRLVGD